MEQTIMEEQPPDILCLMMVGGRWMKLVLKVQTETALPMVQPSAVLTISRGRLCQG